MRDDQYIRLQQLEEKLADQLLIEADPVNWSGDGLAPAEMTQQQRGDRYWCKKNAVATMSMTLRIGSLIGQIQRNGNTTPTPESGDPDGETQGLLDAEVAAAEKEAKRLLANFQGGKRKVKA